MEETWQDEYGRRQRRTTIFLIITLIVLLLLLVGLLGFYLRVVGDGGRDGIPVVTSGDLEIEVLDTFYGFGRTGSEQFDRPHDVNVDSEGDIYVSDMNNGRVVKLSPEGRLLGVFGHNEWGPGLLSKPHGTAVGPDGRVYITDGGRKGPHGKIMILAPDLETVEREIFVEPDTFPITPRILGGELYVTFREGVRVYNLDGDFLREWGSFGTREGQFRYPNGITAQPDGTIVVSDSENARIGFYDSRGTLESVVGTPPVDMNDRSIVFQIPTGIASDEYGLLYLAEAFGYQIRVLDQDGGDIGSVGDFGEEDGEFNAPGGIAYEGDGVFLVADELNHRVVRMTISVPEEYLPADAAVAGDGVGGALSGFVGLWCLWALPPLIVLVALLYVLARRRRRREPVRETFGETAGVGSD